MSVAIFAVFFFKRDRAGNDVDDDDDDGGDDVLFPSPLHSLCLHAYILTCFSPRAYMLIYLHASARVWRKTDLASAA